MRASGPTAEWQRSFENGLQTHPDLVAAVVVAAGFLLRLWAAWGTFLDPDEALHFLAANQPSLLAAYRASLETAHPPLFILLLNVWRVFGSSEFVLRLPSVIAGTIFCWFVYRWLTTILGWSAGWIGLLFAAFLPPMIQLSSEVRQYALLLCFIVISVYLLERALAANSSVRMLFSFLFLYLAMLTHFAALLLAAALGAYGLLRLAYQRRSASLTGVWVLGQALAIGLFLFLYRTHIVYLRGSRVEARSIEVVLSRSYFHWGHDHLLPFIFGRTFGVCQFAFGQLAIGDLAGLAFLVGIFLLLRETGPLQPGGPTSRQFDIFLILPFAANCGAAIADLYPYGGTRHSSFLVPFVIAGVSFALTRLAKPRPARGIAVAILLVAASQLFGAPHRPYMPRRDQSRQNMSRAIDAIRRRVRPTDPVLVDFQSFFVIRYYLCPDSPVPVYTYTSGLQVFSCAGHQVFAPGPAVYLFSSDGFLPSWKELLRQRGLQPGATVWVFEAGWETELGPSIKAGAEVRQLEVESFGRNINLFQLAVGQANTQ